MCLLTVFPLPDLMDSAMWERLHNGAAMNPHGSGWAVISNGQILTGKDLDGADAVDAFLDAYALATGPAIFHSRWATHGSKTEANVHPFPVRKLANTYVAHNGIMPMDAWPTKDDLRSDTRVFADDILPIRYRRLDSAKVRAHLDHWLEGNKIAILTTNPNMRRNLYMFGTSHGQWVDGVWFSNSDHEGFARYYGSASTGRHDAVDDKCLFCNLATIDKYGYCETCLTCQDCGDVETNCQCYSTPMSADIEPEFRSPLALEGTVYKPMFPQESAAS